MVFYAGKKNDYIKYMITLSELKGKTACIDIDNTLSDVNTELKKRGYDISIYPHPELNEEFWKSPYGKQLLSAALPIKNTLRLVQSLKNAGCNLVFATSRPPVLAGITYDWINKNIKPLWQKNSVIFTKNKTALNADIYVEDDPFEILRIIKANKAVFIPRWPYNEDILAPKLVYYNVGYEHEERVKAYAAGCK